MSDTGKLRKRKSECSYQESNLRTSVSLTDTVAVMASHKNHIQATAFQNHHGLHFAE